MKTVLVAYVSRHGSTREIAEVVAGKLREFDLAVDCLPADEVRALDPYDAVVLGSAVYGHHWRHRAVSFMHHHAGALSVTPFWIFSSGPVGGTAPRLRARSLEPPRVLAAAERLGVRGHVSFGGRLPRNPSGPIEHLLVARTPKRLHDRRDWSAIRTWAAQIGADLQAMGGASPPESSG